MAAVGTVAPRQSLALTGTDEAGFVGTLTPDTSVSLSGLSATGAVGTVTPQTAGPLAVSIDLVLHVHSAVSRDLDMTQTSNIPLHVSHEFNLSLDVMPVVAVGLTVAQTIDRQSVL